MVIFQGKVHQASWYKAGVPKDWQIAVSDKWTSDDLGLHWLKAVFDPYTRRRTVGTRRLLILDGHGSHPLDVGVNHIEKEDFLPLYVEARGQALSPSNIRCGFMATGIATMMHGNNLSRRSRPDGREKKSYASQDSVHHNGVVNAGL
ncbi:DDE superfamily endonuclease domain-containing protein [Hirsutella rhossiliensis]|uniref:DDE superfamily endonuclease domain-containing protein n=1 Tax=Hirsutella rhossiliensis TaxID=111463 RepID=A0A9P8MVX9_9HYPO|nr:DDE superfamily endonuclease domain-containing protein [Hirsutella rhossiliensis]KAH0961226.1 DDE superfamily endonuclease domain-containing protein [Hirsutella rhossiliensis]